MQHHDEQAQRPLISQRKSEHLALCASGEVDFRDKTTLLEQVQLIHQALPERHLDEVDLTTRLLGKTLKAPIVLSAMTGGTDEAQQINCDLARAAETLGLGFGLGSQRAQLVRPETTRTFQVRQVAPTTLVLGNLGVVQAGQMTVPEIRAMCETVGADALCIHLATAMELVQPGGDRDFRGGLETLQRLKTGLDLPIVVKETGCGLSRQVGLSLQQIGIRAIDVSGAGGTSWVGVETHRSQGVYRAVGEALWDWGVPTAVSVAALADLGFEIVATGGLRNGLDVARSLALGATAGGLAAPVLRAWKAGGYDRVIEFLQGVIETVKAVTLLCGCPASRKLRQAKKVLGPALRAWLDEA